MTYRVLLLASYCGDDDSTCTDDLPCMDCLKMCNIASMRGKPTDNLGGWDYNRDLAATGLPRDQAIQKVLDDNIRALKTKERT